MTPLATCSVRGCSDIGKCSFQLQLFNFVLKTMLYIFVKLKLFDIKSTVW